MPFLFIPWLTDINSFLKFGEWLAYLLITYSFPLISLIYGYKWFGKTKDYGVKFFILYFIWIFCLFPIALILSSMMAGFVDGLAADFWKLKISEITGSFYLIELSHIFFIPYIFIVLLSSYFSEKIKLKKILDNK